MSDKVKACTGTHGGINSLCDSCVKYENHLNRVEADELEFVNIDICRLPVNGIYWSQYESLEYH